MVQLHLQSESQEAGPEASQAQSKRASPGKVVHLKNVRHDQSMLDSVREIASLAEAGRIHGIAIVVDHGGNEFSYVGHGSLVRNKIIGHAVVSKLARKFL